MIAQDLFEQILFTVVDAEVRAVTFRQLDSFIGAGAGNDFRAEHLGHLNAAITERAGGTHHQHPFAGFDVGFASQLVKGHGKVARDHASFGICDVIRQLKYVPGRNRDILGIAAPVMKTDVLARDTAGFFAFETLLTLPAGDKRNDRHAVADRKTTRHPPLSRRLLRQDRHRARAAFES